jgi:hypothetical protein
MPMTHRESGMLVAYVAGACPQQKMNELTPDAWHDILGHLDYADCRQAARAVASRQPFVAPSEIITEIAAARSAEQPHSNACRGGDHRDCRVSWCMCACHPQAVRALTEPGAVIPERRALPAMPVHGTGPKRYEPGELRIGRDVPDE